MRLPAILGVVLVLFIAAALVAENRMNAGARSLSTLIAQAEKDARLGNHAAALATLRRFERRWTQLENKWALVTDHQEMDQVHLAIERADRFLATRSLANAQAELAALRFQVTHIPTKESLNLKSLL